MASTAAVLNILVSAQTGAAQTKLLALEGQLQSTTKSANATSGALGTGMSRNAKIGAAAVGGATLAAYALGKGLVASVKAASSFESSFAEVRKTVNTNERGFKRIERGLRKLATEIPTSVEELNNLAGEAGALGIKARDIVTFTRVAAQLGTTTNLSSSEAANALARLSNIMGTSSSQFENMASALVGLGNAGASTEAEIAAMALRIAATGKQVGLSEADVLGFASALSSVGIEAEAGGSAISRAFALIATSVATGNSELAGFARIAQMSVPQFSKLFERDAAQGMLAFINGLGQIKENGGNALVELEKLGINEVRLRNALLSAAGASDLFNEQLRLSGREFRNNSALSDEARKRYQTFDSQVQILKQNFNELAISAGQKVLPALTDMVRKLNQGMREMNGTSKRSTDLGRVLKIVSQIIYGLGKAYQVMFRTAKRLIQALIQIMKSFWGVIKNVFGLFIALITGDFRKAWDSAKKIVRSAIKTIIGIIKFVTAPVRSVFQGIVEIVRDKFKSAYNAAVNFVNSIIKVINKIPGVDIGLISLGSGEGSSRRGAVGRQRGGPINMGKASGDSVPAMLERGEYVLNRQAVQKVGVKTLNRLNFKDAPRFQKGGPIGMNIGGYVDAVTDHVPGLAGAKAALGAVAKAANFYVRKLPKPNLPEPIEGTGPWVIEKVKNWLVEKLKSVGASSAELGAAKGDIRKVIALATGKYGLRVSSGFPLGTPGVHSPNSYHYQYGRAVDLSNGVDTPQMRGFSLEAASIWGRKMKEMFYDPLGWYIKNGSRISGAIGGHSDHVHVAMQRGGLVGMQNGGEVLGRGMQGFRKGGWVKMGATIDPTAGQPQYGNFGGMSYAELLVAGANAHLRSQSLASIFGLNSPNWVGMPMRTPLKIRMPGRGEGKTIYKLDNGSGQTGDPWYKIDLHQGIANALGWRPNQDVEVARTDGKGVGQPSLKQRRKGKIEDLWKTVRTAKKDKDKDQALWKLLSYYAKVSVMEKDEKRRVVDLVKDNKLMRAARFFRRNAEISGEKGENENFLERLQDAKKWGKTKARREKNIAKLWGQYNPKGSPLAKYGALWPLLEAYAQFSDIGWKGKDYITGLVRRASGMESASAGVPLLEKAVDWFRKKTKIQGGDANDNFLKRLKKAKGAGESAAAQQILKRATEYPQAPMLKLLDFLINFKDEEIALASAFHQTPESASPVMPEGMAPDGTLHTEEEVAKERGLNLELLGFLQDKRGKVFEGMTYLSDRINEYSGRIGGLTGQRNELIAKAKKSPPPKRKKLMAQANVLLKEITNLKAGVSSAIEERDGNLSTELIALQGYTGMGGRINDVNQVLRELGYIIPGQNDNLFPPSDPGDGETTPTDPSEGTDDGRLQEIAEILRQQLFESQRALAISQAQMPIFEQYLPRYHSGGIVGGYQMGGEVPIMAQAGEGIFTREQMAALSPNPNVTVVIEDGAIDKSKIRVEVDGVLADKISSARRQIPGRSYASR